MLNTIPEYHDESLARRARSQYNKKFRLNGRMSNKFKSEKDFNNYISEMFYDFNQIHPHDIQTYVIPDIVITHKGISIVIELKTTTSKSELAKALGQSILYMHNNILKENVFYIICVPSDCLCDTEFISTANKYNIKVCTEEGV